MLLGLLLISLAAISWGTTGATMTVLARDAAASPLLVGWARMTVAAACLAPAAFIARPARPLDVPPGARNRPRAGALALGGAALGVAMAAYQLCYFRAVPLSGVTVTALLAICSAPVIIALLAAAFLGERLTGAGRLSLVMAVMGTALLVGGPRGPGDIAGRFGVGALLALGAGLSYAVYAVIAKRLLASGSPLALSAVTFTVAALVLTPTLLGAGPIAGPVASGWPLLVYLGVGPTAVAYVLFTQGLARVPATAAGIASLLEPLTASALGAIWFGERLEPLGWAGAVLLLAALAILARARPR